MFSVYIAADAVTSTTGLVRKERTSLQLVLASIQRVDSKE